MAASTSASRTLAHGPRPCNSRTPAPPSREELLGAMRSTGGTIGRRSLHRQTGGRSAGKLADELDVPARIPLGGFGTVGVVCRPGREPLGRVGDVGLVW